VDAKVFGGFPDFFASDYPFLFAGRFVVPDKRHSQQNPVWFDAKNGNYEILNPNINPQQLPECCFLDWEILQS